MTTHIDKIVPTSAIFLSFVFAFSAYHLASANSLLPSQKNILEEVEISEPEIKHKILIVPGHDNNEKGAEFGNINEAKVNLLLAEEIIRKMPSDQFEIFITRDESGYRKEFEEFFNNNTEKIHNFINQHKKETRKLIEDKTFEPNQKIKHNRATEEMANRLYSFNLWANENDIDLVLHIHFNDYPREDNEMPGKYKGYSIYIPEKQLKNHSKSFEIAEKIEYGLSQHFKPSNLKIEEDIIIESQSLISVGANNTLNVPSVLVEYGYIYEDYLLDAKNRAVSFDKMSGATISAIKDYFNLESSS
jgi:N-acetylmuramoyl-L-alanine amidase